VRAVEEALGERRAAVAGNRLAGRQAGKGPPAGACTIFVLPPSRSALEQRLKARSTDSEEVIKRRLQDAAQDLTHWAEFDYVVINGPLRTGPQRSAGHRRGSGRPLIAQRPEVARFAAELLTGA